MKKKLLVFAALLVLALACASIALADEDVTEGAFVDWGELDEIAHVGGHDVRGQQWVEDEEPTCEGFGQYHIVCNVGDTTHIHYVYVKPLNHTYDGEDDSAWDSDSGNRDWGFIVKQPTCQEEGLAVDVCNICGALNEEKTRTIQKTDHVYNDETYEVVKEPSCGENGEGLGQHKCVNCGELKANEPEDEMVVLDKIAHDWSDWREDEPSTCDEYGIAARTCIRCGATQFLDEQNPVRDHGVVVTIEEVLPLKNPGWEAAYNALNQQEFADLSALEQVLAGLNFEYFSENELTDCYTRTVTYTCPYCDGLVHDDITAKYGVVEHEFLTVADAVESVPATCTKKGYNVYLCKYDNVHGHVDLELPDYYWPRVADDRQIVEVTDELGHDFGEWMPFGEPYTKDGEEYQVYVSFCSRCDAHQQETKKLVKDGFIEDENGWRLWNDGVPSEESGFIYVKQEDNWFVLKGGYLAEDVTGFQNMFGREWMVENGELQKYNNGLVPFKGGIYAISEGMLWKEWNGIHWLGDEAYLLQFGQWFPDVNRVFFEGSNAILITNGKVDHEATTWTDPVTGKTYDVINGIIQGY